jgi:hypothetical protein
MQGEGHREVRAPAYGIGGLLGVTLMALLLAAVPAVRWFALFSIPLGIVMAVGIRASHHLVDRQSGRIIWSRNPRHFHWPHPIG